MNYLGGMTGIGVLRCGGVDFARASYDLDGFAGPKAGVNASGEIVASAAALRALVGRSDIQLFTDGGRLFDIRLSGPSLGAEDSAAHVDVTGGLPDSAADWPR